MRPDLMQYATPVLDRPVMLHMSLTINRDCGCTCFIQSGITVGISARFLTPHPLFLSHALRLRQRIDADEARGEPHPLPIRDGIAIEMRPTMHATALTLFDFRRYKRVP